MVTNILFESVVPLIKKNFFYQIMVGFFDKLDFNNQTYLKNGNIGDYSYKGKLLFTIQ